MFVVILNTFHFNVNWRTTHTPFSLTLTPRPQESAFFAQIKSLFHGPTYRLQETESGCIVLSQKNSLTPKYLHVVAKEDLRVRTVGGRVVPDGSQL